jgi:hypothetical protein
MPHPRVLQPNPVISDTTRAGACSWAIPIVRGGTNRGQVPTTPMSPPTRSRDASRRDDQGDRVAGVAPTPDWADAQARPGTAECESRCESLSGASSPDPWASAASCEPGAVAAS